MDEGVVVANPLVHLGLRLVILLHEPFECLVHGIIGIGNGRDRTRLGGAITGRCGHLQRNEQAQKDD